MRVSGAISGPVWGGPWEVDSGVNSRSLLVNSRTLPRKPHKTVIFSLHLAVGRALGLEYTKYGVREGPGGYPV